MREKKIAFGERADLDLKFKVLEIQSLGDCANYLTCSLDLNLAVCEMGQTKIELQNHFGDNELQSVLGNAQLPVPLQGTELKKLT